MYKSVTLEPISLLGYPVKTVIAEKLSTAITLGNDNTRVRDYIDIYTLTGLHDLDHATVREALTATTQYRQTPLMPLSSAAPRIAATQQRTYTTYRARSASAALPESFVSIARAVIDFADPLTVPVAGARWNAAQRRWLSTPEHPEAPPA